MKRLVTSVLGVLAIVVSLLVTADAASATVVRAQSVTISGYARVGLPLRGEIAVDTGWNCDNDCGRLRYQWMVNGRKIRGATKSTFMLSAKYKGMKVTLRASAQWSPTLTYAGTSRAVKVLSRNAVVVSRRVTGAACPSKRQIVSAVHRALADGTLKGHIPQATLGVCARVYAGGSYVTAGTDGFGGPVSNANPMLLKRSGTTWNLIDRYPACERPHFPKRVYEYVCVGS